MLRLLRYASAFWPLTESEAWPQVGDSGFGPGLKFRLRCIHSHRDGIPTSSASAMLIL